MWRKYFYYRLFQDHINYIYAYNVIIIKLPILQAFTYLYFYYNCCDDRESLETILFGKQ